MTRSEMEDQIRNLNERAGEVAQILPKLATRDDLAAAVSRLATKEDLKAFATKEDLKAFATKEDLKAYATKENLEAYATREDLAPAMAPLATKEDLEASKRYTENHILIVRNEMGSMADDIRKIEGQVAILIARRRRRN